MPAFNTLQVNLFQLEDEARRNIDDNPSTDRPSQLDGMPYNLLAIAVPGKDLELWRPNVRGGGSVKVADGPNIPNPFSNQCYHYGYDPPTHCLPRIEASKVEAQHQVS
ncbi:hypothetical protein CR513_25622, partial [Mucuna pruriens]